MCLSVGPSDGCGVVSLESQGQTHPQHHRLHVPSASSRVPQPDVDVARPGAGHQERL